MTIMLSDLLDQVRDAGGADRRLDALIAVAIDGYVRNGAGSYCAVARDGSVQIPDGAPDILVPASRKTGPRQNLAQSPRWSELTSGALPRALVEHRQKPLQAHSTTEP